MTKCRISWFKIWLYIGQGTNAIACILCAIGSCFLFFDLRSEAVLANEYEDIFTVGSQLFLKLLSLFYLATIDDQYTLADEKTLCVGLLKRFAHNIEYGKCESWELDTEYCIKYKKYTFGMADKGNTFRFLGVLRVLMHLIGVGYALGVFICW